MSTRLGQSSPAPRAGPAPTYAGALAEARAALGRGPQPESAQAESELLLSAALLKATGLRPGRLDLYSRGGEPLPEAAWAELGRLIRERARGIPLQHLTGTQRFLEHDYETSPAALIPRPETEILVRAAIETLRAPVRGFELGAGTGVISVELLHAFPGLEMTASEISSSALALAGRNARAILGEDGAGRLQLLRAPGPGAVFEPVRPGQLFDFVISNPPYLARGEATDEVETHEPGEALWAPPGDLLYFYRRIAEGAPAVLGPGGLVLLEIPHERAAEVLALFAKGTARLLQDLNGRERVLIVHDLAGPHPA